MFCIFKLFIYFIITERFLFCKKNSTIINSNFIFYKIPVKYYLLIFLVFIVRKLKICYTAIRWFSDKKLKGGAIMNDTEKVIQMLANIQSDISTIHSNMDRMQSSIDTMQSTIVTMQSDISSLKEGQLRLEQSIHNLEKRQDTLEQSFARMEKRQDILEQSFARMEKQQDILEQSFARMEKQQDALKQSFIRLENTLTAKINALFDAFELRGDQILNLEKKTDQRLSHLEKDTAYLLHKSTQYDEKFAQIANILTQ